MHFFVYILDANLSLADENQIRETHEAFCKMTNVGQIVSRLFSRNVITSMEKLQQLHRSLKYDGSFAAASKKHFSSED